MPPGTSSPSRIVPPIEESLDPPWPPDTPVRVRVHPRGGGWGDPGGTVAGGTANGEVPDAVRRKRPGARITELRRDGSVIRHGELRPVGHSRKLTRGVFDRIPVQRGKEDPLIRVALRPLLDDVSHVHRNPARGSRDEREHHAAPLGETVSREAVPRHRRLAPALPGLVEILRGPIVARDVP